MSRHVTYMKLITIAVNTKTANVDDIIETANHFKCIDMIIDHANYKLSESFIKKLHATLKNGTSDSRKDWFTIGDYKKLPNEVGAMKQQLLKKFLKQLKIYCRYITKKIKRHLKNYWNFTTNLK